MPIQLSGSLVITGSITTTGGITISGSILSASYSSNSDLLQGTGSVGFATTASLLAVSSSQQQISASLLNVVAVYATTGSNSFRADQSITGSLVVSSTITAQTLVVQTVTSSIVYSSGSNVFGSDLNSRQTFTGSVNITGSLTVNTTGTEFQVNNNGVVMGNVLTDNHSITGSLRVTGSTTVFAGSIGINGSPGNSFPIESYINSSTTYTSTSRGNVLRVYNSNTTANIYAGIELGGAGASNDGLAGINGIVTAAGSGDLAFYTRNSNTFGEKMRITSAGLVGIGTTNPVALTQIEGSDAGAGIQLRIKNNDITTGNKYLAIFVAGTTGASISGWPNSGVIESAAGTASNLVIGNYEAGPIIFQTNGRVEKVRIDSLGNVGIGTTPASWDTAIKAIEIGYKGTFYGGYNGAVPVFYIGNNAYYNSGWLYANTSVYKSLLLDCGDGNYHFQNAAAGTAGAGITWTSLMRITSDGKVGIGFTTVSNKLQVAGEISTHAGANTSYYAYMNYLGTTYNFGSGETGDNVDFKIAGGGTWTTGGNFRFYTQTGNTTPSERMRITSGGNVLINTQSSLNGARLEVLQTTNAANTITAHNNQASPYGLMVRYTAYSPNNSDNWFVTCEDSTTTRIKLQSNGGIGNYSGNNTNYSDIRLKKDIVALESYWDKFKAIEIVKFKYKDQIHDDYNIGVIAQQIESTAPEFVSLGEIDKDTPEDGIPIKSIYTEDLHHATIKVLQEAMAKIETLEAKVTALETK